MTRLVLALAMGQASGGNLLVGLSAKADRAGNVERMTDGKAPEPGDIWDSMLTSKVEREGSVLWDFGAPRDWEGVWIQADNNDVYVLQTSDDASSWVTVFESLTVDNPGMQSRLSTTAQGHGRYLKLSAKGGDGSYSVGELAVFTAGHEAKAYVPAYQRNPTAVQPAPFDGNWVVIAVVLAGVVLLVRRMRPAEPAAAAEPDAAGEKRDQPKK